MAVQLLRVINNYIGLAGDTKPTTDIEIGSTFEETDTGTKYTFTGTGWFARTARNPMLDVSMGLIANVSHVNKFAELAESTLDPHSIKADICTIFDSRTNRIVIWVRGYKVSEIRGIIPQPGML